MNWKKLLSNALLIVMILGFTSCFNDDEEEFSAEADVYFVNKLIDNEWMHGTAYYVYGNQSMTSASVTTPVSSETINLQPAEGYYGVLTNYPEDEDLIAGAPEEGNYNFEIQNEKGEILYSSDEQDFEDLAGAEIDTIEFNSSDFYMRLTWNEIEGCDGYYVRMFDSSDELVFDGYGVTQETTEFIVSQYYSSGNWSKNPEEGEEYSILLQTFLYDDDATEYNYAYNIKEVTITDTTAVWNFE